MIHEICKKSGRHSPCEFDVPLDTHSYIPKGRCFYCGSPAQYKTRLTKHAPDLGYGSAKKATTAKLPKRVM